MGLGPDGEHDTDEPADFGNEPGFAFEPELDSSILAGLDSVLVFDEELDGCSIFFGIDFVIDFEPEVEESDFFGFD
jgi:hypothetical protein